MTTLNKTAKRGYAITQGTGRRADDSVEELEFDDTEPAAAGEAMPGNERPRADRGAAIPVERIVAADETGVESVPENPGAVDTTDDDLTPDTLLNERAESEPRANDQALEVADIDDIGAGFGLDEAELARKEHPETRRGRRT